MTINKYKLKTKQLNGNIMHDLKMSMVYSKWPNSGPKSVMLIFKFRIFFKFIPNVHRLAKACVVCVYIMFLSKNLRMYSGKWACCYFKMSTFQLATCAVPRNCVLFFTPQCTRVLRVVFSLSLSRPANSPLPALPSPRPSPWNLS